MAFWNRGSRGGGIANEQADAIARLETLSARDPMAFRVIEHLGALSSIAFLVVAVVDLRRQKHSPGWAAILVLYLCWMFTIVLMLLYFQEIRGRRRVRYSAALPSLHRVFHLVRDAESSILLNDADAPIVMKDVVSALSAVAETFTLITAHRCRVCIKQVHYPQERGPITNADSVREVRISTFARDVATGRKAHDDGFMYADQNTAFEVLFLQRDQYAWFCGNDLVGMGNAYKNLSWDANPPKPKEYLSTCVWPIQKVDLVDGNHDVVAFLCVDSLAINTFDHGIDFDVGAAVADALYPLLKLLRLRQQGHSFKILTSE